MATKECIICGTIMNNVRSDKKYCSRKCQNAAAWKNKNKTRITCFMNNDLIMSLIT